MAATLSNDTYTIQKGSIQLSAPSNSWLDNQSTDENAKDIQPQADALDHDVPGTRSTDSLRLRISPLTLDYGPFTPTSPTIRSQQISIDTSYPSSAVVTILEDHLLQGTRTKATIPPTSCDNGACSETLSSLWENVLTYGFGYRCESSQAQCTSDFPVETSYQQIPTASLGDSAVSLLRLAREQSGKGRVVFKLNVSGTQIEDQYSNQFFYTLNPGI